MSLLGLDIGTSSCKGCVFTHEGHILALASKEYSPYSPQPGMIEMKGETFWEAVVAVIRELTGKVVKDSIETMTISSHGETFIPVNEAGKPVGPAIMNADNRGIEETKWLERNLGKEKIYSITGLPLHPMYGITKILWLKKHRPEIFNAAKRFVSVGDFILQQLGMPPYTDYSLASRVMAFNTRQHKWSDEILEAADLKPDRLSIPLASGQKVGNLCKSMARILGLGEGTIIGLGGHDQPCGALGAGAINQGDIVDSAGTYECLTAVENNPFNGPGALKSNLNTYCHVVPDKYVTLAFFPAGVVLHWFRDEFDDKELEEAIRRDRDPYKLLIERVPSGPTGIYVLPHFVGSGTPSWNPQASGAIIGLKSGMNRYHMLKAILEGIACELKINLDILKEVTDASGCLRTIGGGAYSPYWLQLRADVTERKVASLRCTEAVCLGAAILAGIAAGVYSDVEEAVNRTVKFDRVYTPDFQRTRQYAKQVARYKLLYPALKDIGVY